MPGRHRGLRRRPAGLRGADRRAVRGHRGRQPRARGRRPAGSRLVQPLRARRGAVDPRAARHRAPRYLGALPLVREIGDATLVHASPAQPDDWDYLVTAEDGFAAFSHFATRWCFVGHSHVPGAWSLGSSGPDHEPRRGRACEASRGGATSSTSAAWVSPATGIRARPGRCGTWRPGGSTSARRLRRRGRPPEDRRGRAAAVPGRSSGGGRLSLVRESLGRAALLVGSAWTLALAFPVTDWGWAAWIALIPLLVIVLGAAPRIAFAWGWLTARSSFSSCCAGSRGPSGSSARSRGR